ncbi:Mpo1-like protein [Roseomonas sp. F4]
MNTSSAWTYDDFWLHYLRQHAHPRTRLVHVAGTLTGLVLVISGLVAGPRWLLPVGVVFGYGAAWGSHLLIEGNRPATFGHPLWSLMSDARMTWLLLTDRLGAELRRAGLS